MPEPTISPRVFISYKWESTAHVEWVRKLATDLRTQGIDAILDQWEVRLGDSLSTYMSTMIGSATAVLFIVTPGLVASMEADQGQGGAIQFEVQMSIARHLHGESIRLIAAYRSGSDIPLQFRDNLYVDFRNDAQYDESLARLVSDLLGEKQKPALSATDNPLLELTRRIQDCWITAANIGSLSSRMPGDNDSERAEILRSGKTEKSNFEQKTQELGNFISTRAFLFPPEINNITYLIWHDFMDFEFRLGVIKFSDLYLAVNDLVEYAGPKITFLQKALYARANGKRPPRPALPSENKYLYRSTIGTAILPAGALDIDTLEDMQP